MAVNAPLQKFRHRLTVPFRHASFRQVATAFPHPCSLVIQHSSALKPKPADDGASLPFGKIFTDHMLTVRWSINGGWGPPTIEPFGHLSLHPASLAFNHGQAVFEGMKAFRSTDGSVRLFRPELNMNRLETSAARMSFPAIEGAALLGSLKKLIALDADWVPHSDGSCLYIRPVILECGAVIGSFAPTECLLVIMCSPSGSYFGAGGIKPIRMLLNEVNVRAAPGGVGYVKAAGNYAPTFALMHEAKEKGCAQVLFTFQGEVGECAAMNVFFLLRVPSQDDATGGLGHLELVTPPLTDGTVLAGVTRQSVLDLARDEQMQHHGPMKVSERKLSVAELKAAAAEGRLVEAFGSGTAVVVQPVETLVFSDGSEAKLRSTALGEAFLKNIQDIQYGRVAHTWSVPVS